MRAPGDFLRNERGTDALRDSQRRSPKRHLADGSAVPAIFGGVQSMELSSRDNFRPPADQQPSTDDRSAPGDREVPTTPHGRAVSSRRQSRMLPRLLAHAGALRAIPKPGQSLSHSRRAYFSRAAIIVRTVVPLLASLAACASEDPIAPIPSSQIPPPAVTLQMESNSATSLRVYWRPRISYRDSLEIRISPNGAIANTSWESATLANYERLFTPDESLGVAVLPGLAPSSRYFVAARVRSGGGWSAVSNSCSSTTWTAASLPTRQLTTTGGADAAWSPDGTQIAYEARNAGEAGIRLMPASGGQPFIINDGDGGARDPAWWPDGSRLLLVQDKIGWIGDSRIPGCPCPAPYTHLLVAQLGNQEPPLSLLRTSPITEVIRDPAVSPTGAVIAYAMGGPLGGPPANGSAILAISTNAPSNSASGLTAPCGVRSPWDPTPSICPTIDTSPAWALPNNSIGGDWFAFVSGSNDILIQNGDNTRTRTVVASDLAQVDDPTWSPDGNWLAIASRRTGNWDIWIVPLARGPARQVTFGQAQEFEPAWSPLGGEIAFTSTASGREEIWIVDVSSMTE